VRGVSSTAARHSEGVVSPRCARKDKGVAAGPSDGVAPGDGERAEGVAWGRKDEDDEEDEDEDEDEEAGE